MVKFDIPCFILPSFIACIKNIVNFVKGFKYNKKYIPTKLILENKYTKYIYTSIYQIQSTTTTTTTTTCLFGWKQINTLLSDH